MECGEKILLLVGTSSTIPLSRYILLFLDLKLLLIYNI